MGVVSAGAAPIADPGELLTEAPPAGTFAPGQIFGNRYRIRSLLGRGGMGEVWRALDLKLRVDVALKALRESLLAEQRFIETLRQEVRVAREVVSPNVCRVFDLVELDGRELVSMEYVDGTTLAEVLSAKSPLPLDEASEIASQLLAGLEAIHGAGLVHRDIKPENVMLTRAGRVVVMDFGIAKALAAEGTGTVAGTAAYMAPEQARGESLDARADVFSAGIVLAEMAAPAGTRDGEARGAVWAGIHRNPPELADTPWAPVLRKAVAPRREQRHPSAAALARALEEVTLRVAGAELLEPYPGLAFFNAEDAAYFFGRELEIESMWRKLRRPHLLALVGPSGAGKSSFLRAGLLATAPAGWRSLIATPGDRPFKSLAQALIPELSGDPEALELLLRIEEPEAAVAVFTRWRRRHEHGLLVIDQFEELFTQNPPEVQAAFAALIGRLALDADVHVLLSLRDDFLFRCHAHEALAPILSELTLLGPPTGAALRRAIVQPALKCGYRFEDEGLVDAMLAEVEGERGALPLVAFAAAQLWQRRDRERGVLTREAYAAIGGVAGALAQHAEATLERIGHERVPVVRELFRNLVTAQGTRATVEREELLSVFAGKPAESGLESAAEVLDALIDARLLTSYELPPGEGERTGQHRIEIIHESLLSQWPRLVHWQAQDQEGSLLRDQLRQATKLWEQRGQPEDLLWTGASFREYELWRERYAGSLSAGEETFTRAMTDRARRRRRRRRLAVAAVVFAALAVTTGMGVLWRRSEGARAEAVTAARHAEGQQIFALGQLELDKNPTAALAYALASLEHADTPHARVLALQALWRGPTAFALAATDQQGPSTHMQFSPNGQWLAELEAATGTVRLWENKGSGPRVFPSTGGWPWLGFSGDSRFMVVTQADKARVYSLPDGELVRQIDEQFRWGFVGGQELITGHLLDSLPDGRWRRLGKIRRLPDGEPETVGVWASTPNMGFHIDPIRQRHFFQEKDGIYEVPFREIKTATPRRVIAPGEADRGFFVAPDGERIYTWDEAGVGKIWSRATGARLPGPRIDWPADSSWAGPSASLDNRWFAIAESQEGVTFLWDLAGPAAAEPRALRRDARTLATAFDPSGAWLATRDNRALNLWPSGWRHPHVLRAPTKGLWTIAIDPRRRWVAAAGEKAARAWVWPLRPELGAEQVTLDTGVPVYGLAVSPRGDRLAAGTARGAWLVPVDGGRPERLPGFEGVVRVAFDREGRRLAVGGLGNPPPEKVVRVYDLETREAQVLDLRDGSATIPNEFLPDGRLLTSGTAGVRMLDLATGRATPVLEGVLAAELSPDGRQLLGIRAVLGPSGAVGTALVSDLEGKEPRSLDTHGNQVTCVAWDPAGRFVVTGSRDGIVRVGAPSGEEPHLLLGHEGTVRDVAVDPERRWIASTGEDGTVRLWPLPGEGPPLHTLPHDELLERLRSLTNYRVVKDPATAGGYRLDFEPLAGWNRPPPSW
ncbi:MAG TPA: protein kinase [Thermoanaerobaculia bacterium]|nr:protein kinase [Thermoanaerobaculia bacterium]